MSAESKAREGADATESGARKAASNPVLESVARAGWVVKGLLYGAMGALAMGLALGRTGATDQRGSLKLLTNLGMFGDVLLVAVALALAGYAAWSFLCALLDPLGQHGERSAGRRLGFLGGGVAYTALLLFCLQLVLGQSSGTSDRTLPAAVGTLLDRPFGPWLAGLAGAAAIVAGIVQVVLALLPSFGKELEGEDLPRDERRAALALGRFGAVARGIVFGVIGWFVVQAAVFRDPHQAKGLGGALGALAHQPAGRVLLIVIALGFVALALYSFATARWMRTPGGVHIR
jgi:Domain of Unknown Function (DUF1206)